MHYITKLCINDIQTDGSRKNSKNASSQMSWMATLCAALKNTKSETKKGSTPSSLFAQLWRHRAWTAKSRYLHNILNDELLIHPVKRSFQINCNLFSEIRFLLVANTSLANCLELLIPFLQYLDSLLHTAALLLLYA